MKAKEYIATGGSPEDIIVAMNAEFFELRKTRAIATAGGIVPLFKEFDIKWRIIAKEMDFPADLFQNVFLETYPEIAFAIIKTQSIRTVSKR